MTNNRYNRNNEESFFIYDIYYFKLNKDNNIQYFL